MAVVVLIGSTRRKNNAPSRLGSGGNRPNSRRGADFRLLSGIPSVHHILLQGKHTRKNVRFSTKALTGFSKGNDVYGSSPAQS